LISNSKLEKEISELEQELKVILEKLEKRGLTPGEVDKLKESYTDITLALDALIEEWQKTSQTNCDG
jgi:DNA repair ATPase RecN